MKKSDRLFALVASTVGFSVGAACGGAEPRTGSMREPLLVSAYPAGFTFKSSATVSLSASRPSKIFYTLNGDDPTKPTAIVYATPIEVQESTLITFIGVSQDRTWSSPAAEFYQSEPPPSPAPGLIQRGLQI